MSDKKEKIVVVMLLIVAVVLSVSVITFVVKLNNDAEAKITPLPSPTYDPYNISKTTVKTGLDIKDQDRTANILDRFINAAKS